MATRNIETAVARTRRRAGTLLTTAGVLIAFAAHLPASAQIAGAVETGDASSGPRNVIPWLQEALEGQDAGPSSAASGRTPPSQAPTASTAPRDVFGGVFGEPRGETEGAGRAPNAAPERSPQENRAAARNLAARTRGAAAAPSVVEIGRLKAVDGSAAGLLSAKEASLPADAWREVSQKEAVAAFDQLKPGPYRAANLLAIRALSAGLAPPEDAQASIFLKSRIDALTRFGASKQAALLAAAAGGEHVGLGADAALVSGQEQEVCAGLTARPDPSLARIYCQFVAGDALSAALSIEAARALGKGDETTLALLEAVGDPASAKTLGAKEKKAKPTPLRLAAQRSLKLTLPADFARDAPFTLLPAALNENAPPRLRLEAMERMEAAGAVETDALAKAFAQYKSAESGGVWGRVEAYRKALAAKDADFAAAVTSALKKAKQSQRGAMMARLLAPEIAKRALPVSGATPEPSLTVKPLRQALRIGGEFSAAAAVSRAATRLAPAAQAPQAVENALDYLSEPKWPGAWTEERAQALAAEAESGNAQATFLQAALARLELPPGEGGSPSNQGQSDGKAALRGFNAIGALNGLVGPTDPAASRVGLETISVFQSLGWRKEARALALEIAETM